MCVTVPLPEGYTRGKLTSEGCDTVHVTQLLYQEQQSSRACVRWWITAPALGYLVLFLVFSLVSGTYLDLFLIITPALLV